MNINDIKNTVNATKRGTIRTLTYSRPMKTRKGVNDIITKQTTMQVRFGVRYDNMQSTINGRADGTLPTVNQGLHPSLIWVDDNFIQNTKTGNIMLRVAYANGNKTMTKYYRNGIETSKEAITPLCLASETASREAPTVLNIGIEKIDSII